MEMCKQCRVRLPRIQEGNFGKSKRWVDDQGRLWNGKCCPSCNLKRMREANGNKSLSK